MTTSPTKHKHILVVDDEPDLRTLYELTLLREGFKVQAAGSLDEARDYLAVNRFDVVITDMRLPDGLGLRLLEQIRNENRPERCIVITAHGSADNAVECLKAGAFDYLTKPVDLKQFRAVIASAVQDSSGFGADSTGVPAAPGVRGTGLRDASGRSGDDASKALARLAGTSEAMFNVRERIVKVAKSMAPVLIRGESGTGKELVARALHANSHRRSGALVAVNCSAIPENLLETEFFGSKKGAYTGSTQDRDGFFQSASGGTLFLDEIGDLPLAMQAKLLRAIQERCVRPVGASQEEPVNVRIVSATHKDLAAEVNTGHFRQDLYYRLNVIDIFIPPLRERLEDLPLLCETLLARIAQEAGIGVPKLPAKMLERLALEPLHGNVRELENLLHRAVALYDGQLLEFDLSGPGALAQAQAIQSKVSTSLNAGDNSTPTATAAGKPLAFPAGGNLQDHLDQHEREILVQALQATAFNRTAAAARLGLSLRQIRYRIARLNIEVPGGAEGNDEAL
jgi:two-component system, NtrC family, response regulator PilR